MLGVLVRDVANVTDGGACVSDCDVSVEVFFFSATYSFDEIGLMVLGAVAFDLSDFFVFVVVESAAAEPGEVSAFALDDDARA